MNPTEHGQLLSLNFKKEPLHLTSVANVRYTRTLFEWNGSRRPASSGKLLLPGSLAETNCGTFSKWEALEKIDHQVQRGEQLASTDLGLKQRNSSDRKPDFGLGVKNLVLSGQ